MINDSLAVFEYCTCTCTVVSSVVEVTQYIYSCVLEESISTLRHLCHSFSYFTDSDDRTNENIDQINDYYVTLNYTAVYTSCLDVIRLLVSIIYNYDPKSAVDIKTTLLILIRIINV